MMFMNIDICRMLTENRIVFSQIMGLLAGHETWKSSGDNVGGCHQMERAGPGLGTSDGRMLGPLLPEESHPSSQRLPLCTVSASCGRLWQ